MKIKPKKITNKQIQELETLSGHFNKEQLQKNFVESGVRRVSIYKLSFSDARRLINQLHGSLILSL